MATSKNLNDLLLTFMQDIYYAERQILKALPKMAKAAQGSLHPSPRGNPGPGRALAKGIRSAWQACKGRYL